MQSKKSAKKEYWPIVSIVVILIVGGLIWFARPRASDSSGSSAASVAGTQVENGSKTLAADETEFDFGSISMRKGVVKHTFAIQNTSPTPISLTKMYTSCMCTRATLITSRGRSVSFGMPGHGVLPKLNETLAAGERGEIEVAFDPEAHGPAGVGSITRTVYLEQDSGAPLELTITALVTP